MNIQKDSIITALYKFNQEMNDLGISSSEKVKLSERFKYKFEQTKNYEQAAAWVLDAVIDVDTWKSINKSKNRFSDLWKSYQNKHNAVKKSDIDFEKGFLGIGGRPETDKMLRYIDIQLLQGVDDHTLANALMVEAMQQMGSNYSDKMTQFIRDKVTREHERLNATGAMLS